MQKIILGAIIAVVTLFIIKYCNDKNKEKIILKNHTTLIQKQIKNVGKLIVSEGHFSEVFTYKNSKAIFGDLLEAKKQAIVVANADVTIGYDLSKIEFYIDEKAKTLQIIKIPKAEISINPDLEYYDIKSDFFNPFKAEDYNKIKKTIKISLMEKIEISKLKSNAQNRLISELAKFFILTNSMGWRLEYKQQKIKNIQQLDSIRIINLNA